MTPTERAAVVAETEAAIVEWLRSTNTGGVDHIRDTIEAGTIAGRDLWLADAVERGEYRGVK